MPDEIVEVHDEDIVVDPAPLPTPPAVIQSARAGTNIAAIDPNEPAVLHVPGSVMDSHSVAIIATSGQEPEVAVMRPDGTQLGTTRNVATLFARLEEQLREDMRDPTAARNAAVASLASILGITFDDALRRVDESPQETAPTQGDTIQANPNNLINLAPNRFGPNVQISSYSFERVPEPMYPNNYRYPEDLYSQSYFVPSGYMSDRREWERESVYTDSTRSRYSQNRTVSPEMTRQDFQLIATIVDDAARNLADLFNERIETQPKSFFQAAPVNPVTYEEVKKLLASLIADGFEGKWKFDREKFMEACKMQERR